MSPGEIPSTPLRILLSCLYSFHGNIPTLKYVTMFSDNALKLESKLLYLPLTIRMHSNPSRNHLHTSIRQVFLISLLVYFTYSPSR